ncbi:MAG: DUF6263 family protein [Planctomycetota bacterium]|jgi:hypothetical protein
MKRRILTPTISIFCVLLFPCVLAGEDLANDKLDLKLRLKPGQKYGMQLTTEFKRSDEKYMYVRGIGFEVQEVDPNGVAMVRVTYQTFKQDVHCQVMSDGRCRNPKSCRLDTGSSKLEHFQYDSTSQSVMDDYSNLPACDAAGVGESFIIKVTTKGEIIKVDGLEQMHKRIVDKINAWDQQHLEMMGHRGKHHSDAWKEVRRHNTEVHYSEREIRNLLSDMIIAFPTEHLAVGDSWKDKVKIWTKEREIEGNYTLKGIEKGTVTIDLTAKRTPEEEPFSWVNNEGREVGFKLVGSCEGMFEVDQQAGWLLRSKVKNVFTSEVIDNKTENKQRLPILEKEIITVEALG